MIKLTVSAILDVPDKTCQWAGKLGFWDSLGCFFTE